MEYISLRCYDIRERVAPIRISVIEDKANTEATETRVPFGKGEIITSKNVMVTTMPWLTTMAYLCHSDNRYFPLIASTSRFFYSFTTYYQVCKYITTTGATSGSGSTDPSAAPEFTPVFICNPVTRPLA